ncbi:MAG: beta-glycosidase [Bacteroidaceae bacterium]|nr:beta-glycosidase [Bacteroidaceae bacterium]
MRTTTTTCLLAFALTATAQTFTQYTTTEQASWQQKGKTSLAAKAKTQTNNDNEISHADAKPFISWGTCFNELGLDAIRLLKTEERDKIMHDIFAPDGDLRFTRGRLTMNANDYSRAWYSCDTVPGDFALAHFNIEHDKQNVIELIKMAQHWQPDMTFWVSPWSPPAWMKVNQDYPVLSSQWNHQPKAVDALLFGENTTNDPDEMKLQGERGNQFPRRLATQDYFIQDPRYLQAYANMFCRFIELYGQEGIPINTVMYQNEAYSYTPYPGCAWTAEGTIRFNRDYLHPTLKARHPEVHLYLGTFNTNRQDHVQKVVDGLSDKVEGLGFQWEGREILDQMRERYPQLHLIQSESECGNGSMDWRAGEHTFFLLHEYVGRGCDEYFIWNFILSDNGQSSWGWKQNALVQVDSKARTYRYTAEYYAVKHFSHFIVPGSKVLAFHPWQQTTGTQSIVFERPDGKRVVVCGNTNDSSTPVSIPLGKCYLNATLQPHSFNTFVEK